MTAITNQDFTTYAGDDVLPIFTVYASDLSTVVDISSVTEISWSAIRNDDGTAVLTKTKSAGQIGFVTTGADGKFQVTISKTDTVGLTGNYRHIATLTDALGNITTIEVGRMRIGPKPRWTYDASTILTMPLYQVRRLIGDVIEQDAQIYDDEVRFALSQRASVYGAAADCARYIAGQYSRKVDTVSPGEIRTAYGSQAKKYADLADQLDNRSRNSGAGVQPFAGGISVSDKVNRQQQTDRVTPQFALGMNDNLLVPLPPIGIETPTNPASNGAPVAGI